MTRMSYLVQYKDKGMQVLEEEEINSGKLMEGEMVKIRKDNKHIYDAIILKIGKDYNNSNVM